MQALVSACADLDHADRFRQSVLLDAAISPSPEVLPYFVEKYISIHGALKDAVDPQGNIVLHYAARHGRSRAVKLLLEHKCGADAYVNRPNSQLYGESTPLLEAADCISAPPDEIRSCVEALVAAGADISAKRFGIFNVLHIAAKSGNAAVISFVGQRITRRRDRRGAPAAAAAVGAGRGVSFSMVEDRCNGMTPLLIAAENCQPKAIRALIALGADVEAKTKVNWENSYN